MKTAQATGMRIKRVASGHYETPDGRYMIWQVPDVCPPAWNVEDTETFEMIVNGAATKRDAIAIASEEIGREEQG